MLDDADEIEAVVRCGAVAAEALSVPGALSFRFPGGSADASGVRREEGAVKTRGGSEGDPKRVQKACKRIAALVKLEFYAEATSMARKLPPGDLVGWPHHECYWQFLEPLAERAEGSDPALAGGLYELVIDSMEKEASQATGAGEAYRVLPEIERVERKRSALGLPEDRGD